MIALDEDEMLLRRLVFSGLRIDRRHSKPCLVIPVDNFPEELTLGTLSLCQKCDREYKPFVYCNDVIWVKTACPKCLPEIWAGYGDDSVLPLLQELLLARSFTLKFDQFCNEFPWLIQESFAYKRCFVDWCREYDHLHQQFKQEKKGGEKQQWFKSWFGGRS